MPDIDPPGEVPSVNASGQGTQVGSGNTQYNTWMAAARQQLDPGALAALNPHAAVARLRQLPDDDLVDFFARAKPGDVREILAAFLEVDEARVVAVLADINHRKATELVSIVGVPAALAALPEAGYAITRKAARLKWTDAGPLERYADGYVRKYRNGRAFWVDGRGTYVISGAIEACWIDYKDFLRSPDSDQEIAPTSPFGSTGARQAFMAGTVYSSRHGFSIVPHSVGECYADEGETAGWLGFPLAEERRTTRTLDYVQRFEGGSIRSANTRQEQFFAVRPQVEDALDGSLFYPASRESGPIVSSHRTSGRVQQIVIAPEGLRGQDTAVYTVEGIGATQVDPGIWDYYCRLGAENSWLGFPVEKAKPDNRRPEGRIQGFEGGEICWGSDANPIAVPEATMTAVTRLFIRFATQTSLGLFTGQTSLGLPVTEEQPVGPQGSDRIQFFVNGVVTLRDGRREIWLRPRP